MEFILPSTSVMRWFGVLDRSVRIASASVESSRERAPTVVERVFFDAVVRAALTSVGVVEVASEGGTSSGVRDD
jgi:hypothetical protein